MAWPFMRHPFATGLILDHSEFNANVAAFASEANALEESNWTQASLHAIQDAGQVDGGIAIKLHVLADQAIDPFGGSAVALEQTLSWLDVPSTSYTFRTKGGQFVGKYDFQISNVPSAIPGLITGSDLDSAQTGLMFGVRINGSLRYDSLLGSGDLSNDNARRPTHRSGTQIPAAHNYYGTGPAIMAEQGNYQVHFLARLGPGEYTVSLGYRNTYMTSTGLDQEVSQRDGWMMELWS